MVFQGISVYTPALATLARECKGCPGTLWKGCHGTEHKRRRDGAPVSKSFLTMSSRGGPPAAEEGREAEVHSPQPCPSWTGRATGRLALEQLPSLRHGRSWHGPDRVASCGVEAETTWEATYPRTSRRMKTPAQASLERGTQFQISWLRWGR